LFRFSMNTRDFKCLSEASIHDTDLTRDENFQKKIWQEFLDKHPEFDPQDPNSDGFEEGRMIGSSLFFRMENEKPQDVEEAILLIKCKLFFAPNQIWLENKKYWIDHSQVKNVYLQSKH